MGIRVCVCVCVCVCFACADPLRHWLTGPTWSLLFTGRVPVSGEQNRNYEARQLRNRFSSGMTHMITKTAQAEDQSPINLQANCQIF